MDYFFFFFISSLLALLLLAQQGCTSIAPLDEAPSVNTKYEPCQGGTYWCAGGISVVWGRE